MKKIINKIADIFKQLFSYLKTLVFDKLNACTKWIKNTRKKINDYSAQSEKNKKRVKIYFILAIVIVSYFAFSIVRGTLRGVKAKRDAAKERIIPVFTYTTKLTSVTEQFKINGNVMAENSVNIMPDIGGKLVRYTVQVGDTVRRGQTVAYIDPSRPGTIYNLSPVPAPLDGTISSLPIELGNTVTTTTVVGQLGDLTQLKIEIYVPERFVEMIHIGKEALVTSAAFPNSVFKAQIYELAPTLDPQTRTLLVKLRVTEGQDKLLSGMFSELLINARTIENVLTVPSEAVIMRSGKKYVYIIDKETGSTSSKGELRKLRRKFKTDDTSKHDPGFYDGKAHMIAVETDIQAGEEVIITKGLNPGDRVVYSGQDLLNENALARIVNTAASEEDLPSDNAEIDSPSSVEDIITRENQNEDGTVSDQTKNNQSADSSVQAPKKQKLWFNDIFLKIKTFIDSLYKKKPNTEPVQQKPDTAGTNAEVISDTPSETDTPAPAVEEMPADTPTEVQKQNVKTPEEEEISTEDEMTNNSGKETNQNLEEQPAAPEVREGQE